MEVFNYHSNKDIANVLSEIGMYYHLAGDKYRSNAYTNGSEIVKNYDEDVVIPGNKFLSIHGIGPSINASVKEYLTTGKVERLEQLRKKYGEQRDAFIYFQTFYKIGPVKAANLVKSGYITLEQLWTDKDEVLTSEQQKGIFWRNHINETITDEKTGKISYVTRKIPRKEMNLIHGKISEVFDNKFKWVMAGSYRREESSSGDIDILIEKTNYTDMDNIVNLLSEYIPNDPEDLHYPYSSGIFSQGPKKFSGMFRLSDAYYGHRIDILLVEPENWAPALLHFTGSGRFNILMRNRAKSFGWKLSEYHLTDQDGNKILVNNEKDIFNYLKVEYLAPVQRTKILTELTFI